MERIFLKKNKKVLYYKDEKFFENIANCMKRMILCAELLLPDTVPFPVPETV